MANINTPATGHVGPAAIAGGHQYLPYGDHHLLAVLRAAVTIIDGRIRGHRPCNEAFSRLPGGHTFAAIWADRGLWINYDPSLAVGDFGASRVGAKEVTITQFALRKGHWTVAATLVHELAHVNGAPGGRDHSAEHVLTRCLLAGLHDPHILGEVLRAARTRPA
jgi:hypothetical protein